ncbi:MAG: dihydroneopterin aldolase [Prevotellaceae bacterium]|jgi:dihydroneopterin aldolase|nr:dihydroneopterin aldolase [Prevotellaceae bacterium]
MKYNSNKMIGIIELENMEFYAYHGCFTEERTIGNLFIVDLYLEVDVTECVESDNLNDALSYPIAYEIVKREMERPSNLLEHVAARILQALYDRTQGIKKVKVKVSKMNPPIGGKVEQVSVTLSK